MYTGEEVARMLRREIAKGGISNPSHNITQENFRQHLVKPHRVQATVHDYVHNVWIVYENECGNSGYAIGIHDDWDPDGSEFAFLCYTVGSGKYHYLGSFDSFAEAVNNI